MIPSRLPSLSRPFPLSRRGIIFSLIGILISVLFLLLFWSANSAQIDTTSSSAATRVLVMNSFLTSSDSYLEDATRIAARAALTQITGIIQASPQDYTVPEMQSWIASCIANGSYQSQPSLCFADGNDLSLDTSLANLSGMVAKEMNLTATYAVSDVSVNDSRPFQLLVSFTLNSTLTDPLFARWERTDRFDVLVDVDGLPDPLFARYGNSLMKPGYGERNITRFNVSRDKINLTELARLLISQEYIPDQGYAPSYLEQLAGNLTVSPNDPLSLLAGYETLILPENAVAYGTPVQANVSYTAQQYFFEASTGQYLPCSEQTSGAAQTVGINQSAYYPLYTSGFRLDLPRMAQYNVNTSQMLLTCS